MLMGTSSEMVHSLLPMFMVSVLGASTVTVGKLEGLAESIALIVKVFSGALSDYLGKRKMLALLACTALGSRKAVNAPGGIAFWKGRNRG